jgi:uncharacterized protein involved in type VI secretion and phage assembly
MANRSPTQSGKRLAIYTVLDERPHPKDIDPLLLMYVKGVEDISQPFTYTVKMWRLIDNKEMQPIAPGDLVNTPVAIDVNLKQTLEAGEVSKFQQELDDSVESTILTWVRRYGVFETFSDDGIVLGNSSDVNDKTYHIRQYSGTIVPGFKMLAYETTYCVFEDKTVLQIIHEIIDNGNYANFKLDDSKIKDHEFPVIPYCVQFGESTLNFLSRLMARFRIYYYFDHNLNYRVATVVLGLGQRGGFPKCQTSGPSFLPDHPIWKLTETTNSDLDASVLTINQYQRAYAPTQRHARFGNFNILNPIDPITYAENVQPVRDLINPVTSPSGTKTVPRSEPNDDDHFRTEQFAAPVDQNSFPEPPMYANSPSAKLFTNDWIRNTEAVVAKVSGASRNPALMPGFIFDRVTPVSGVDRDDDDDDPVNQELKQIAAAGVDSLVFQNKLFPKSQIKTLGTYVIIHNEFDAVETAYGQDPRDFGKILTDLMFPNNMSNIDLLANGGTQGINNYMQNVIPLGLSNQQYPATNVIGRNGQAIPVTPGAYFGAYTFGGAVSALTAAIPILVQALEKRFADEKTNQFHNSFSALPVERIEYLGDGHPAAIGPLPTVPLPVGIPPRTNGPQLAVVIGENGVTDPDDLGQVYADGLGRVRVRFAWDRAKGEKPGDSFKRGIPACWVRVSDGWAGRHFGSQFLPRVGQEVIVDFIDGDPDRPIITGRVYNADGGTANMPFPQGQVDQQNVDLKSLLNPTGYKNYRFTGLKTRSLKRTKNDKTERYHLVRYDDSYNCEQYLLRSQGRLDVTAFMSSFETTYGNKNVTVLKGKLPDGTPVGGNMFTTVDQEYDLHVGTNRYEQVDKDYELTVKGNVRAELEKNLTAVIKGDVSIALNSLVIEATKKITLKVGQSFIVIDPCEIHIKAPAMIYENSGGTPGTASAVVMQNILDAALAEPGDRWNYRVTDCTESDRGHTQRGTHTGKPTPAPDCGKPGTPTAGTALACNFLDSSDSGSSSSSSSSSPSLSSSLPDPTQGSSSA